ncbi:MAG: hypothetical protein LBD30_04780 [Verrucomicrobiales bacterium]|nr:hypothetical protein [Verrucomicrobiales bacterium]
MSRAVYLYYLNSNSTFAYFGTDRSNWYFRHDDNNYGYSELINITPDGGGLALSQGNGQLELWVEYDHLVFTDCYTNYAYQAAGASVTSMSLYNFYNFYGGFAHENGTVFLWGDWSWIKIEFAGGDSGSFVGDYSGQAGYFNNINRFCIGGNLVRLVNGRFEINYGLMMELSQSMTLSWSMFSFYFAQYNQLTRVSPSATAPVTITITDNVFGGVYWTNCATSRDALIVKLSQYAYGTFLNIGVRGVDMSVVNLVNCPLVSATNYTGDNGNGQPILDLKLSDFPGWAACMPTTPTSAKSRLTAAASTACSLTAGFTAAARRRPETSAR